jgi:hypothetical protein
VAVNRLRTKRRQARHLLKQFPEYAAPLELGNYSAVIYKYFAPTALKRPLYKNIARSAQLPLLRVRSVKTFPESSPVVSRATLEGLFSG